MPHISKKRTPSSALLLSLATVFTGCADEPQDFQPTLVNGPSNSVETAVETAVETTSDLSNGQNPATGSATRSDISAAAQPASTDEEFPPAEGDFPLSPDPLTVTWKTPVTVPQLPTSSNYEYSSGQTPFFAFGFYGPTFESESWNLAAGSRIGAISGPREKSTTRSLSPDGTRIAFYLPASKTIEIWSYESGTRVSEIQLEEYGSFVLASAKRLLFSRTNVTKNEKSYSLMVYDVDSGQLLKERPPVSKLEDVVFLLAVTASHTGRYIAHYNPKRGFRVFDTESLELVARIPVKELPRSGGGRCSFSHDGTRLAAMSVSADEAWIFVASLVDGSVQRLSLPEPPAAGRRSSKTTTQMIEWLPDDSGWVIGGDTIVDAEFERPVWKIDVGPVTHRRNIVLPGVLLQPGSNYDRITKTGGSVLQASRWPQEKVRSLVQSFRRGDSALLQPGDTVAVRIDMGSMVAGHPESARVDLLRTVKDRLKSIGMNPTPNGDPVALLSVAYSEAPGRLMRKNGSFLSALPDFATTGIESVAATVELKLQHKGDADSVSEGEVIWSAKFVEDPIALSVRGRTDMKTIEAAVFAEVQNRLKRYQLPYFVSDAGSLPGVTRQAD